MGLLAFIIVTGIIAAGVIAVVKLIFLGFEKLWNWFKVKLENYKKNKVGEVFLNALVDNYGILDELEEDGQITLEDYKKAKENLNGSQYSTVIFDTQNKKAVASEFWAADEVEDYIVDATKNKKIAKVKV